MSEANSTITGWRFCADEHVGIVIEYADGSQGEPSLRQAIGIMPAERALMVHEYVNWLGHELDDGDLYDELSGDLDAVFPPQLLERFALVVKELAGAGVDISAELTAAGFGSAGFDFSRLHDWARTSPKSPWRTQ